MSPGPAPGADRTEAVRFGPVIQLTKRETFAACQALADADRVLVRAGCVAESNALADLFDLFEERLAAG